MSIQKEYIRSATPTGKQIIDFSVRSKLISSIPVSMKTPLTVPVESSPLIIPNDYLVADNTTPIALVQMPTIGTPYMLFIDDLDGSVKLIPAGFKDSIMKEYNILTKGAIIGHTLRQGEESLDKSLVSTIIEDGKVPYSINGSDVSNVKAEVVNLADPFLSHSTYNIQGVSSSDRSALGIMGTSSALFITINLNAAISVPLWTFQNVGILNKNLSYMGFQSTSSLIFSVPL